MPSFTTRIATNHNGVSVSFRVTINRRNNVGTADSYNEASVNQHKIVFLELNLMYMYVRIWFVAWLWVQCFICYSVFTFRGMTLSNYYAWEHATLSFSAISGSSIHSHLLPRILIVHSYYGRSCATALAVKGDICGIKSVIISLLWQMFSISTCMELCQLEWNLFVGSPTNFQSIWHNIGRRLSAKIHSSDATILLGFFPNAQCCCSIA